ncbi:MAG: hypothetical protein AAGJ35_07010 [Myxococcota bacterium]
MVFKFFVALIFSAAMFLSYNSKAIAQDSGCCVPNSMIVHMAEAYDVQGQSALSMMETLAGETFADLRLLQSTPTRACDVYLMCDEIPEEFFRVLLVETIERKKAAVLDAQQSRAFIFTLLTAIVAVAGLVLGIFNTWHSVRKKGA